MKQMDDWCSHERTYTINDGPPYTDNFGNWWQDYVVLCHDCGEVVSKGSWRAE